MGAIKVTPADSAFSKCIRALAGWCCERCGTHYPEGANRQGLHCSHFHGRGKWGTRFNPDNAASLCYGCHQHLGSQPAEHEAWFKSRLGDTRFEMLQEARNDINKGREYNRTKGKGEIARHYREQLKAIEAGQEFLVAYI